MELTHPTSCGQGQEKESLPGEVPEGTGLQRFKRGAPKEREDTEKISVGKPRRRWRAFHTKQAEQIMKYRMRGHLREEKTKSSREHETVRHDSRVGEMKRTVEIKKKVRYFGNSRTGNRMAKGVAPGAIGGPLRLII